MIPTIIGKALIKAPIQSLFVLYLFTDIDQTNYKSNSIMDWFVTLSSIIFMLILLYFIKTTLEKIARLKFKSD